MKKVIQFSMFLAFLTLFSANVFAYDLWIEKVQVISNNENHITGTGITGNVSYNSETNTLTLDNATITRTDVFGEGIYNKIEGLTINLIGENQVTSNDIGVRSYFANFTITGSGSLTINAGSGISIDYYNLTIKDTRITINGSKYGIGGSYGNETVNITNSTIKATGTGNGSIRNLANLNLGDGKITEPEGAVFNTGKKAVCIDGNVVKTEVVIEPLPYTVSGTVTDGTNPLAGVTIAYNGGTTTTVADGTYSFAAEANTSYTVTPSLIGYAFTPITKTVNVVDANVTGQDFVGTVIVTYDLYVAGVQVTNQNKDDILDDGKVTYDPNTNTLTLNNAGIQSSVYNTIPDLTIELTGENTITAESDGIKSEEANFKITGTGSLTINSSKSIGIYQYNCNLTIENTTVTSTGKTYGICGQNGNGSEILTIKNSTVKATGASYGSIADIKKIVLDGCEITQPSGAAFDVSKHAVCLNGNVVTSKIVIEPTFATYDLYVAGVQVTAANKGDISSAINQLGKSNISASGAITYDSGSNTLTLDGAEINITAFMVMGIQNKIADLTINLIGKNTLTTENEGIYSDEADFTITGDGSLTINTDHRGLAPMGCNLTIENTTVTAIGGNYGIQGHYEKLGVLTINNSTVKATGTRDASIRMLSNLVLYDCAITQPEGAVFDASKKSVCLNGEIVKTEVVIEPGTASATYTVSGIVKDNKNNPLAGVTIAYNGGTTTTAANGTYSFTAKANTTYTVTPTLTYYAFAPATKTVNVVEADVTGQDFVGTMLSGFYTVSGIVKDNENISLKEVTIAYNSGTTTTAANGTYSFIAEANTSYTVTPSLIGYAFTPITKTVNVVDANVTGIDFVGTENAIEPPETTYALSIGEVEITDENKDDITAAINSSGNGTASGTITYAPTTNTLTLNNASIDVTDLGYNIVIKNKLTNLTIKVIGENYINIVDTVDAGLGIYSVEADLTITGSGSLTINTNGSGISCIDCNLTILNTIVTATGEYFGIMGLSEENNVGFITINNSTVRATGTFGASIACTKNIVLNDCEITQPMNTYFGNAEIEIGRDEIVFVTILDANGEVVTSEVVITAIGSAVENVESNTQIFARNGRIFGAENAKIYDILGRDVTRMNGNLQGIYIVKTEKTATKIVVR